MTKESAEIVNIRRPKILMQAARICAKGYRRETMLPHLLGANTTRVLAQLKAQEKDMEDERQARISTYSPQAHVEVLSALMAESNKAA
ncbi:MAG: hypothetical protein COB08_008135 [Rhodobacteraceae bacterium]|nr:hypothetical protein [Paracoccaceae bacterium]